MSHLMRIVKYERWHYRVNSSQIATCKLETFFDPRGRYSILVTERSDNPGPSVTNSHEVLRREIVRFLRLSHKVHFKFYEWYDRDSYNPSRDDLDEVCQVYMKGDSPHWEYVSDEDWELIYSGPRQPRQEVRIRKKG